MKQRLAYRLAVTYGLIFILAVAAIDTALILVYRQNQLKKNEAYYYSIAGMLASMAGNNVRITDYVQVGGDGRGSGSGRVLLLDRGGKVVLDSGGDLAGVRLTNPEFRTALEYGKPATGYYTLEGKGLAMFSYPVTVSGDVNAVVLISVFIQDIYDDVSRFAWQIIAISALVTVLVVAASVLTGKRLSGPIEKLTDAAGQISGGNSGATVEIERDDEIGRLASAFNRMSAELQRVEAGRRRFISDVSHELKTPLASIKALLEAIIADGEGDAPGNEPDTPGGWHGTGLDGVQREYLMDMDHEIDRLTGLVRSLITSARLEEITIKPESLVLTDEVERALRALAPLAARKGISLENRCAGEVVIKADRDMLREILVNLVDNAIKYGVEGGMVRIECSRGSFSVIDDGAGIPGEELSNIFDRFYRVDRSRTGDGGSGIGLFIVKRIAELHGFSVKVSSKPGEGSTFTVLFGNDYDNL